MKRLAAALAVLAVALRFRRPRPVPRRHPLDWPWETDPVLCELDEGSWSRN